MGGTTAGERTISASAQAYRERGYLLHDDLISADLRATLARYLAMPATRARLSPCAQVPGARSLYGDAAFDSLLATLTDRLSEELDIRLAPTYSFLREYVAGNELDPHRDRPECDHSVTAFIDSDDGAEWPIWVRDREGCPQRIVVGPGAGLSYRGQELEHWREPCPSHRYAQVFLHYVDLDGPLADRAFDGRHHLADQLGRPARRRPVANRPATRIQVEAFGVRVVIDDETGTLERALRRDLPTTVRVARATTGSGLVVRRYRARRAGTGRYELERDGTVVGVKSSRKAWIEEIVAVVEHDVATTAPRHTFVHAGVVTWNGTAVIVPGASGTGKSTLVDALIRQGATYYSDEYAVVDGRGRVHPYLRRIRVDGRSATSRRALDPAISRPPVPPGVILSTRHDPHTDVWAPTIVTGARAALELMDHVLVARDEPARALRIVKKVTGSAVCLVGPRPEADEAARVILEMVDELAADPQAPARRASVRRTGHPARATAVREPAPPGERVRTAPFVRFDDVLSRRDHRRLLRFALARADAYVASGLNGTDGPVYNTAHRRSRSFFEVVPQVEPVRDVVRSLVSHARRELGLDWFRISHLEVQLHAHHHGDFFGAHPDSAPGDDPLRRLSAVYYFYETPRPFRGGELHIYDERVGPEGREHLPTATIVDPLDNSLIIFPSELTHEVPPVLALGDPDDGRPLRHSVSVWVNEKVAAPDPIAHLRLG